MVKLGVSQSVFKVQKTRFSLLLFTQRKYLRNVYGTVPPPSGQNLKQRSWIPSCFAVPADLCATVARLTVATGSGHVVPTLPLTNIAFKRGSQILGGIRIVEQSWTPSTPSTTRWVHSRACRDTGDFEPWCCGSWCCDALKLAEQDRPVGLA